MATCLCPREWVVEKAGGFAVIHFPAQLDAASHAVALCCPLARVGLASCNHLIACFWRCLARHAHLHTMLQMMAFQPMTVGWQPQQYGLGLMQTWPYRGWKWVSSSHRHAQFRKLARLLKHVCTSSHRLVKHVCTSSRLIKHVFTSSRSRRHGLLWHGILHTLARSAHALDAFF